MAVVRDTTIASAIVSTATQNRSITIGAGSNRLLLVQLNLGAQGGPGTAGTFGVTAVKGGVDTAMSTDATNGKVASGSAGFGFVQWFYIADPDVGANTIKITRTGGSGTQDIISAAVSYIGAGTPVFTKATGRSTSASVTFTIASGDFALCGCAAGNSITAGSDTKLWGLNDNSSSAAGNQWGAEKTGASGSVSMTNTITTTDDWGSIGVQVPPAATGALTGAASVAATDTITATAQVGVSSGASVAATDTIAATAQVGKAAAASVAATATITATASVSSGLVADVALAATDTITATAVVGKAADVAIAATDTITATAQVGKAADVAIAATDTITATAVVGKGAGAAVAATDTVTATAQVGKAAAASVAATATITATATVTAVGQADAAIAAVATITATAVVARSTGAAVAATDTITATAAVGKSAGAAIAAVATITATATVSDPSTDRDIHATARAVRTVSGRGVRSLIARGLRRVLSAERAPSSRRATPRRTWSARSAMDPIPRDSVEYAKAEVIADVSLTMAVELAIWDGISAKAWLPGTWTGSAGTTRTARTTSAVTFSLANYPLNGYTLLVRLTDTPEIPIINAGTLTIV